MCRTHVAESWKLFIVRNNVKHNLGQQENDQEHIDIPDNTCIKWTGLKGEISECNQFKAEQDGGLSSRWWMNFHETGNSWSWQSKTKQHITVFATIFWSACL